MREASQRNVAWRSILAATVPPLAAFGLEGLFFASATRWLLFTVALITSSWLGGLKSGIAATIFSTALVWWFLVPPERTVGTTDPRYYLNVAIFAAIGIAIAIFHERLRRARREEAASLAEARRGIDALERTTRELRQSQQILQAVIDYSPGIIAVKDLKGRLLLFNRRLEQALGLSYVDLRGKNVYDLFPEAAAKRRRETDDAAVAAGKPLMVEERVNLKDGAHDFLATVFPLRDEHRNTFGVCWIETDITERKRADEALAQTAADLKEAQRVAHIGSWSWDPKTDRVRWSDELYRIHRRDPNLPPPSYETEYPRLYTIESMDRLRAAVDQLRKDGTPFDLELETILPDGSTRWISGRGEAIYDEANRVIGLRGTSQDITQVKELERAKEEWTSVIAHDLRQPIGVIKMSAELLPDLHGGTIGKEEETVTARIRSASNSLARMVDDLLDVSRLEAKRLALEQVWMDPRTLVNEGVERASTVTSGSDVNVTHAGAPSQIFVDPGRFDQVLSNLLSNAVKYGDKNGAIDVHVDQRGTEVEISVTNRGRGIPPEEASHLFTRFGRSRAIRGSGIPGLGLGLYIAKGIVEAHGGRMWVDSVPDKTTTFHFTMPSRAAAKVAA